MITAAVPENAYTDMERQVSKPSASENGSLSRLNAVVNTAVEAIITITSEGLIDTINPAGERMFGYTAEELVGKNISTLMPQPYRSEHDSYLKRYQESGQAKIIGIGREVVGLRKDGSQFPMDLSVGQFELEDGIYFTGIARDVTNRKEQENRLKELAETLEEKNRELETIVYVASHDLRSPLVNIQGFSKELEYACNEIRQLSARQNLEREDLGRLSDLLNRDVPEAIDYILSGVTKIDALLSGFLKFSRLGKVEPQISMVPVEKVVQNILNSMEFQMKAVNASVHVGKLEDCMGDQRLVDQIFTNLIDNAIKFRHAERTPVISIDSEIQGARVIYKVQDNGVGIAKGHISKVFEIFHRLNPKTTSGDGLGLTMTLRMVEKQKGRIWIESEENSGSKFYVELPLK